MTAHDNKAIVRRLVDDVWNTGDVAAADAVIAPGYHVHSAYQDLQDREQFKAWLTAFRVSFPDTRWTIEDVVAEGDRVAVRLIVTATHTAEFLGIAGTGKPLTATEHHVFRLADGLLVEQWAGPDNLRLLQQIGVVPDLREIPRRRSTYGPGVESTASHRFDKFTERARAVLTLAQEEAQRFNHNYIGTEHLLLGLVREGEGVAAKVLSNLGVELNRVRSTVEFIIGQGDRPIVGEVGLTPRAKKVIELAVDEARRLGHHYIGTEHLLLGLVREGEGIAAGVLESLGVNLEALRMQTIQVLGHPAAAVGVDTPGGGGALVRHSSALVRRGAQLQPWAYLTLQVTYPDAGGDGVVAHVSGPADATPVTAGTTPLPETLRLLGAEGWELVGIDTAATRPLRQAHYVFKRPHVPPPPPGPGPG